MSVAQNPHAEACTARPESGEEGRHLDRDRCYRVTELVIHPVSLQCCYPQWAFAYPFPCLERATTSSLYHNSCWELISSVLIGLSSPSYYFHPLLLCNLAILPETDPGEASEASELLLAKVRDTEAALQLSRMALSRLCCDAVCFQAASGGLEMDWRDD